MVALYEPFNLVGMKYTIIINQLAVIENGYNLDIVDLAIFDFIKDFTNSPACIKTNTPEGIYFWISNELIMENLPLLKIGTRQGIIKRIDNLVEAGILEKHPNCKAHNKSLYIYGANYEKLIFGCKRELHPVNESLQPCKREFTPPVNESLQDYTIKDNNITYDKEREPENISGILFTDSETGKKKRGTTENLCLFANSAYSDFEKFKACFTATEYSNIDIMFYYGAVQDWSASRGKKMRDWIATARNFIRSDMERGKLHVLNQVQDGITDEQRLFFLNL